MNSKSVRILFFGSGQYATDILERIVRDAKPQNHSLVGIVTQPDRPAGRGRRITPAPLKEWANQKHLGPIRLYQPGILSDHADNIIKESRPDLVIVVDYGQMIPDIVLDYPKYRCLNIHHALLPRLRGAVPIPMAILKGLKETGTTIQQMSPRMDAGDIIAQAKTRIEPHDNATILGHRLSLLAVDLLSQTLPDWIAGKITPQAQDETKATYCYQSDLTKEKARIDWQCDALLIDRQIRALYPKPIAWTTFRQKRIQILKAEPYPGAQGHTPGSVVRHQDSDGIQASKGLIVPKVVKPEGKKAMPAVDFWRGIKLRPDDVFI